jgi:uncharacterized protein YyaL (SSP411 family)
LTTYNHKTLRKEDHGRLKVRLKKIKDNSMLAMFLAELAKETGRKKYSEQARKVLDFFSEAYSDWGLYASEYALALDVLLSGKK